MDTTGNETFLQHINDAFARGDTAFFEANVTDDVRWTMVGAAPIQGKAAFIAEIETMKGEPAPELTITNVITHGTSAAVEGTMTAQESGVTKRYAFCDIYRLDGSGTGKIREITAYMIELDTGAGS